MVRSPWRTTVRCVESHALAHIAERRPARRPTPAGVAQMGWREFSEGLRISSQRVAPIAKSMLLNGLVAIAVLVIIGMLVIVITE